MIIYDASFNHKHSGNFKITRPLKYDGRMLYLIVLFKTSAIITENENKTVVEKGTFALYSPDAHHSIQACENEYIDDWIAFDMDYDELKLIEALQIPVNKAFKLYSFSSITDIIHKIAYEFHDAYNPYKDDIIKLLMQILFFRVSQNLYFKVPVLSRAKIDMKKFGILFQIRNEIYCTPNEQYSVEDLARKAFLSKSYFQHIYKQIFGISVSEEITKSRLKHAKYYLSFTDMTIKEIAYQCGFNSDIYFVRVFKKAFKATPTEYRNSFKSQQSALLYNSTDCDF